MASSRKTRLSVPTGGSIDTRSSAAVTGLPTHHHHPHGNGHPSAGGTSFVFGQYISRLSDIQQLDIQSALDQMKCLLSLRPHVVYKTSYYRKQTKNHWYRDDPAFLVLQLAFLVISSIAYGISFRTKIGGIINFTFIHSILWNYLLLGIIITTICREISNRNLMTNPSSTTSTGTTPTTHTLHVKQKVEWMYAFDIHCNSFFPLFVVLYGIQFFLLPLVLNKSLFAFILGNTLYLIGGCWYWYITHLGYRSLPFLHNTEIFLFPIALLILIYVLNIIGYPFGLGWNISRIMAHLYFD